MQSIFEQNKRVYIQGKNLLFHTKIKPVCLLGAKEKAKTKRKTPFKDTRSKRSVYSHFFIEKH